MAKPFIKAFADLSSQASTAALDIEHVDNAAVIIAGTFSGTIKLEVSFDGTNFVDHASITGKTSGFAGTIGYRCKAVKMTCTSYSSGTFKCAVSGDDGRR